MKLKFNANALKVYRIFLKRLGESCLFLYVCKQIFVSESNDFPKVTKVTVIQALLKPEVAAVVTLGILRYVDWFALEVGDL